MLSSQTLNQILIAIAGIITSVIFSKIIYFFIEKYVKALTRKTKTDLDDKLLAALRTPFIIAVILTGVYISVIQIQVIPAQILNKAYFVLIILWVSFVLNRILKVLIEKWLLVRPQFMNMPKLLVKVISIVVYFMGAIIILNHFDIEITPLIATLGLGGIAVGFALQDTLSNFFAGIQIVSDKPISIGDFIELDSNISGYVEDIGWRTTKIKTLPNNIVIIPNSKIATSIITNDSLPVPEMSVVVQCGVSYNSDLKKVEKVTINAAKKIQKTVQGAVKEFEPFIRYHTFADSNINFSIILRVEKYVDKYLVVHEFIKELKEEYDKNNIEISWPVRKIYTAK